ncbi:ribosome small subunit-dependent GTPase A [Pediococcus inopinatus]|mgnify:CR=1 FL=1|uniref:Small ribosomal subunit biogenesis GTPase RsgA n=1 Tax=Pediococcus inopinatus TaxID=114090 RepID=A0ABZ0Q6C1_9LACO|nr:ribosome small subunit-dependent GTPase A [Pediococcus inopinatus]AVK99821.1 ribosome small subunit-dependent GTPase A [Pediococcus inopinatus]KRN63288.1 rsgA protein [Pediococcus inopinatus]WPC17549.1 ribosome small subunit-dependent GTPase A [Pediococcus inopinatus]WPC18922.1 ribosome small subunit-dependent GTPase A [Pediococcus inopinatus]WPC22541.1 ribosome small subunit-dependent GTPase A [Pediococcus inopinatus]
MHRGQIIQSLSGFYDVKTDDKIFRTRARGNFRKQKISPLVGDWVEFESQAENEGYILKIEARRNQLVRPPLANIDQAVVVTACVQPDFSTNLLDRQLVALEEKQIKPIIYFTKGDLVEEKQQPIFEEKVAGYRKIGYEVYLDWQAFNGDAINNLTGDFADQLTIFMGQTGAGKSTLLNHIDPDLALQTGEVSAALNRGKHTTRKVALFPVGDGLVADTPGFSSYTVFEMRLEDLKSLFPEIANVGLNCRFRECLHINEPDCAVKEAVQNEEIMQSRYDNYVQFFNIIKAQKPDYQRKGYSKKKGK